MKTLFLSLGLIVGFNSFAQDNVSYKITKDNPADVNNLYINLDLLQTELPLNNVAGTSFGIGISPYACYNNRFGAEATFRRGWLNLVGVPRTNFEFGGFFNLTNKTITRNQKVILDTKEWTSGDTKYTETKFIKVPAQNMRSLRVRGGFLTNKETFAPDDHPT